MLLLCPFGAGIISPSEPRATPWAMLSQPFGLKTEPNPHHSPPTSLRLFYRWLQVAEFGRVLLAVVFQLLVQRVAVDADPVRGLHADAVGQAHHLLDQLALHRIHDALLQAALRQ